MENLSECCQAEITCDHHYNFKKNKVKKTWICSDCKLSVSTKEEKLKYGME